MLKTKRIANKGADLVIDFARELLLCLIAGSQGSIMILREELVSQQCERGVC
jgi:hypothetical protein